MADTERLRDLRDQRSALASRIEVLRGEAYAHITVPPMERALRALDDLIVRESEQSKD